MLNVLQSSQVQYRYGNYLQNAANCIFSRIVFCGVLLYSGLPSMQRVETVLDNLALLHNSVSSDRNSGRCAVDIGLAAYGQERSSDSGYCQ